VEARRSGTTPTARIDYVLTANVLPLSSRVLSTDASDHLPVLARLVVWRR
jgi:endonuclease/exonuclease/phosphatase (EEP) superfamily protein YafD